MLERSHWAYCHPLLLIAFSALSWTSNGTSASPRACPATPAAELVALPYDSFDTSDAGAAWRTLLNRGCVDMAVATLEAYRATNRGRMTPEQMSELSFHIGQTLAFAAREKEAIPHFEAATNSALTAEWIAYVDATIGFLRKDRAKLQTALARYEKLAPGSMRLGIIRGFVACFDRPYKEAAHCAM